MQLACLRHERLPVTRSPIGTSLFIHGRPITAMLVAAALALASVPAIAAGFVYTADEHGNSISAIDLSTGEVETVPIPISPHNVQITADGSRLLAVGTPVEQGHGHAEENTSHGGHGSDARTGLLVVLNPDRLDAGPIASIPVGKHPAHVVIDGAGRHAFVTDAESDTVAVADLASGRVIRTIGTGRYPHGLRLSPDGREAYVATVEGGSISVVDTATLAEVGRIEVGAAPVQVAFTPNGSRVYVSLRDENSVGVIDTETRRLLEKIPVGRDPIQLHATPDGGRVYVANQGSEEDPDQTVSVIDVATNQVIDTIRTGRGAHGVAVSADGARVFVTNILDSTVSVIDDSNQAVVATFPVGRGPNGVTFRPAKD